MPNGELVGLLKVEEKGERIIVDGDVLRFKLLTGKPPRVEIITALKGSKVVERLLNLSNNQLRINRWH